MPPLKDNALKDSALDKVPKIAFSALQFQHTVFELGKDPVDLREI